MDTSHRVLVTTLLFWLGVGVLATGVAAKASQDAFIGLIVGGGVLLVGGFLLLATAPVKKTVDA